MVWAFNENVTLFLLSASKSGAYKETVARPAVITYIILHKATDGQWLYWICVWTRMRADSFFPFSNPIPLTAPWEINLYEI